MKVIVVSGGVLSGLGKGITSSSIGTVLKARGLKVTAMKIDPYLNFDAGTLNPFEHGEVFARMSPPIPHAAHMCGHDCGASGEWRTPSGSS